MCAVDLADKCGVVVERYDDLVGTAQQAEVAREIAAWALQGDRGAVDPVAVDYIARAILLPSELFAADLEAGLDLLTLRAKYPTAPAEFIARRIQDLSGASVARAG